MRILYVTTVSGTMDFFVDTIKDLVAKSNIVDIACNSKRSPLNSVYSELGCCHFELECARNLSISGIRKTIKQIKNIILNNSYDIVHCHTPIASFCVRYACRKIRKNGLKVIYTAHGFHFYKGAPLKNWLFFAPAEIIASKWTDALITINTEDYEFSKKLLCRNRVYIPGVGIDVEKFRNFICDIEQKKNDIGIPKDALVCMTVGDLNSNKNQGIIIKCLACLPDDLNVHYLLAGTGDLRQELEQQTLELGIEKRVHFLGYRNDIQELYSICDFVVFPSYREGLSVSIMESMACRLPVICSDIRGNRDLIKHNQGGFLCNPNNEAEFLNAMITLASDSNLRKKFGFFNTKRIEFFSKEKTINEVEELYIKIMESDK